MLLSTDERVDLATVETVLPTHAAAGPASCGLFTGALADRVGAFERDTILAELKRSHSNVSLAAKSLGLERSHLYKKAEQLGINLRSIRREHDAAED